MFTVSEMANGLIEKVAHELKRSMKIDPSFDRRVMEEVRHAGSLNPVQRLLRWWFRPRRLALSPAAVAAVAAIALIVAAGPGKIAGVFGTGGEHDGVQVVRFVLDAPAASSVALAGDFNDWDRRATPLSKDKSGEWVATVKLQPGRYNYTFIVDGVRWVADPEAPPAIWDDFGGSSSTITVPEV